MTLIGRIAVVAAAMALACAFTLTDVPDVTAQSAPSDAAQPSNALSHRSHHGSARAAASPGTVIQGGDTISLIATLPWWRIDLARAADDETGQLESPILTACDVWLGFPFATTDAKSLTVRLAEAQHASEIDQVANHVKVADPTELNALDLAAPQEPPETGSPWLRALFALAGVVAAGFSAARYFLA